MDKILLSGSTGFFGKTIINNLNEKYNIVELLNPNNLQTFRLDQKVPIFNEAFDIVLHCAGKAHSVPQNEIDRNRFYQVNVIGTQNLLKGLASAYIPKQFVFISSVAVYGKEFGYNISENENLNAKDPYGLSKIHAEHFIKDWCQKNNVVCTILRLPLLVGENPPGNLGVMVKAIKKGYYFNIGGGKAKKSMVLADDVARFIPLIAPIGGTYNLTDGVHPSFAALSYVIAKKKMYNLPMNVAKIIGYIGDIFGGSVPINSLKIKKITSDLIFEDSKARELGWNPQSVLEYLKKNDL